MQVQQDDIAKNPVPAAYTERAELQLPRRKANFWFTIITLIYLFDWIHRYILAAVLPSIKKEFGITDAAGFLGGTMCLSLALLAIPCGIIVDKWSRKYLITILVTLWSAATWVTGLAVNFVQLLVARFWVGAEEVGIFNMGQTLGQIPGFGLGVYIVHLWGWRRHFGIMAIPGFLLAVSILFAPDYKTKKLESRAAKDVKIPVAQIFKTLSKHQLPATVMSMCQGANIRTALDDNIYYSKGVLAKSNAQLVARMVRLAREIGGEIATVDEAREMMGFAS